MSSNSIVFALLFIILFDFVSNFEIDDTEKEYLRKFGYLNVKKDSPFVSSLTSPDVISMALKNFQRMAGILQTGKMDDETKKMMSAPRCGVRDLLGGGSGMRRKRRYALYGKKWQTKSLTYNFINHAKIPPKDRVEKTIAKAFEYWQNASGLTFKKVYADAVINIEFRVGSHGDEDPFDGLGGTLAHAFFPTENMIGGDAHFDDDEMWTFDDHRGTNLLQVAVHEFGHSLGLSHSEVKESIMAPFYRSYNPNLKLHDDDIKAIQILYGAPETKNKIDDSTSNQVTTPSALPNVEEICTIKMPDAVFSFVDLLFVLQNDSLFVMKGFYDNKAKRYTTAIIFPGLPNDIDAAFYHEFISSRYTKLDHVYFFKGDMMWKYLYREKPFGFTLLKQYPKNISDQYPGTPGNLDGVFEWNLNGKLYFFKGKEYYRFSETLQRVAPNYPRPITNWNLQTDAIDSVFNYPSSGLSETFFISGNKIYKYDEQKDGVAFGYPKTLAWFFGCSSKMSGYDTLEDRVHSSADTNTIPQRRMIAVLLLLYLFRKFIFFLY